MKSADEMIAESMRKHSPFTVNKTEAASDVEAANAYADEECKPEEQHGVLWDALYRAYLAGRRSA